MIPWKELGRSGRSGRPGHIGLDLGSEQAHLAQLEHRSGQLGVAAAASFTYPSARDHLLSDPGELKRFVRDALKRGGFRGRTVVTAMPGDQVRLMVLNYRGDASVSDAERILGLAAERMQESLDESVVDYVPIRTSGEDQGERSALVAIAREEDVIRHLEALRATGLTVEALEIAPVAVRRLAAWAGRERRDDAVLVLHLGRQQTSMTLLWGRRVLLYREVDVGRDALVDAACKYLDLTPESALELLAEYGIRRAREDDLEFSNAAPSELPEPGGAGEISTTLWEVIRPCFHSLVDQAQKAVSYAAFQTRGSALERVHLLSGEIRCPGLPELLEDLLAVPVDALDPLAAIRPEERPPTSDGNGQLALAVGHALRGLAHV